MDSSSRDLSRLRPSTDSPVASTPEAPKRFIGPAVPRASSRSVLVVSHHLDGLLRTRAAGLLHPAASLRFAAFLAERDPPSHRAEARCTVGPRIAFPATRFGPFEGFPSPAAVSHHCDRCPLAVAAPPQGWRLRRPPLPVAVVNAAPVGRPTSGLCSADESVSAQGRFQPCAARSSHGLWSPSRPFDLRSCRVATRAPCPGGQAAGVGAGLWDGGESPPVRTAGIPPRVPLVPAGRSQSPPTSQGGRSRPAVRLFSVPAGPCLATRRAHLRTGDDRRAGASEVCPEAEVRIEPGP